MYKGRYGRHLKVRVEFRGIFIVSTSGNSGIYGLVCIGGDLAVGRLCRASTARDGAGPPQLEEKAKQEGEGLNVKLAGHRVTQVCRRAGALKIFFGRFPFLLPLSLLRGLLIAEKGGNRLSALEAS